MVKKKTKAKKKKAPESRAKPVHKSKTPARKKIAKSAKRKATAKKPAKKVSPVKKPAKKKAPAKTRPVAKAKSPVKRAAIIKTPKAKPVFKPVQAKRPIPTKIKAEKIVEGVTEDHPEESLIEESKFDIGVVHNARAMIEHELPPEYGKNIATLLIVDPRFVFTYWEIRQDSILEASRRLGHHSKLTLRFYDITSTHDPEKSLFWDVEVFDRLGNWYLKLSNPEQRLCLDVGMKGESGEFITLARSNVMKLPPQSLARPGPIKWMVVTPAGDKLISDIEDYTDADLSLLKKILGPYFFDLLMRGRFASIAGSSIEAIFYEVSALRAGESPSSRLPWATP